MFDSFARRSLVISRDEDHCARVWEVETCTETASFRGHAEAVGHPVSGVAFSPNGRHAISLGGNVLSLWKVSGGEELQRFHGHTGLVSGAAILPNGRQAVTGARDGTLRLWGLPRDWNSAHLSPLLWGEERGGFVLLEDLLCRLHPSCSR